MFPRTIFRSIRASLRPIQTPIPRYSLQKFLSTRSLSAPSQIPRTFPRVSNKRSQLPFFSQSRNASGFPGGRRPPRIHYRFDPEHARNAKPLITSEQIIYAWRHPSTKWIIFVIGSGSTIFYVTHLEEVPVSGRKRFICYSDATIEREGERAYNMIMQENGAAILPAWSWQVKMVKRVMEKLIPASGLEHVNWEVHVINSNERNAFVIPGGKVFVYTGIFDIANTDDRLAAILGHEIAHNLARHANESMSGVAILEPLRWLFVYLDATGITLGLGRYVGEMLLDFGIMRRASRKQESEADYIGLMMMAKSCYDPGQAVTVWERMEKANTDQNMPEWMSTHPSNSSRITTMQQWLPKAEEARNESECAVTLGYSQDFRHAVGGMEGMGVFSGFFK